MVNHHPNMQTLTDFAAGSLPFGQSLCVSVHQESCPQCQRNIRALNNLGGELMDRLEPVAVGDDMLDTIMARITSGDGKSSPAELFRSWTPWSDIPGSATKEREVRGAWVLRWVYQAS